MFDRKAVSGFVSLRPGYPTVYSFHLNDAFNFQKNITVIEEQWGWKNMADLRPMWSSTAFWYSEVATGGRILPIKLVYLTNLSYNELLSVS